jgi:hypothetical protein
MAQVLAVILKPRLVQEAWWPCRRFSWVFRRSFPRLLCLLLGLFVFGVLFSPATLSAYQTGNAQQRSYEDRFPIPQFGQDTDELLRQALENSQALGRKLYEIAFPLARKLAVPLFCLSLGLLAWRLFVAPYQEFRNIFIHFFWASLVVWALVYSQWPQEVIWLCMRKGSQYMAQKGTELAQTAGGVGNTAPNDLVQGTNPANWWASWLFGQKVGNLKDLANLLGSNPQTLLDNGNFKFSAFYIIQHLYPKLTFTPGGPTIDKIDAYKKTQAVGDHIGSLAAYHEKNAKDNTSPGENLTNWWFVLLSGALNVIPTITAATIPTLAAVATYLSIYLMQFLVLVGSDLAFRVLMALGLVTIPLAFFPRLSYGWVLYLQGLVCSAVVPWLFFLCAGLGFSFTTELYKLLVEPGSGQIGVIPTLLSSVWQLMLASIFTLVGKGLLGSFNPQELNKLQAVVGPPVLALFRGMYQGAFKRGVSPDSLFIIQAIKDVMLMLLEAATFSTAVLAGVGILTFFVTVGIYWAIACGRIAFSLFWAFQEAAGTILGHSTALVGLAERVGSALWQKAQAGAGAVAQGIRGLGGQG